MLFFSTRILEGRSEVKYADVILVHAFSYGGIPRSARGHTPCFVFYMIPRQNNKCSLNYSAPVQFIEKLIHE